MRAQGFGQAVADTNELDDPVGQSLRGPHASLARAVGRAVAYHDHVATFSSLPLAPSADDWADLAELLGPGSFADLFSHPASPPQEWEPVFSLDGYQLIAPTLIAPANDGLDADIVRLQEEHLPQMLSLTDRTRPGPFWPGTPQLGEYYGLFRAGELVAMAGERLRPPGWSEISAVCTAPEVRGQGLAARLVRHASTAISARGERASCTSAP